ncbi:MAG: VCBS repeat-containing protein [Planctomycetaceae bacterium]|nr:VCBS repeat-containing protein [Planctomycetaceae bacterium]
MHRKKFFTSGENFTAKKGAIASELKRSQSRLKNSALAVVSSLLIALCLNGCLSEDEDLQPVSESLLEKSRQAIRVGNYEEAISLSSKITRNDPKWLESRLILGRAEIKLGSTEVGLTHLRKIPRDSSPLSLDAAVMMGRAQEIEGKISQAIESYEYILSNAPDNWEALEALANLYVLTGQRWKAERILSKVLKTPDLGFEQLVLLTDFERRRKGYRNELERCERLEPEDPTVQMGLALEDFREEHYSEALKRLEFVLQTAPDHAMAQALYGEILLLTGDQESLVRWYEELPPSLSDTPAIWFFRGLWAKQQGNHEIAAKCFWKSSLVAPTAYRSMHQLGRVLSEIDPQAGKAFTERAESLHQIQRLLSDVLDSGGNDQQAFSEMVQLLLDTGREWEAWSWLILAHGQNQRSPWIQKQLNELAKYPDLSLPRIREDRNLCLIHDLGHYPDFSSFEREFTPETPSKADSLASESIRFQNLASKLGLVFSYHKGRESEFEGVRMQESTGGGVGVLDYDHDGRPDLFLTQGEDWPSGSASPKGSSQYHDSLFWNRGGHFLNISKAAGLSIEDGFGQGCACGDFNNDGFTDIYVANIGNNQLLINNGDGTFVDQSEVAGLDQESWTTSVLMADLNNDGNPDLFDVNYVEGEELFQKICNENECSPEAYQSSADHARISLGNGRTSLIELKPDGRVGAGLGIVAFRQNRLPHSTPHVSKTDSPHDELLQAKLNGKVDNRLSLFIANDQEPNFFLNSTPSSNALDIEFLDQSFLSGLALNRNGSTSACMGVASGDVNADGFIDFFVTNYMDEANSLYLQGDGGVFMDDIGASNLFFKGLPYVGWGTQFIDLQNNGWLDLVVTNGHVGDFKKEGVLYRMPTQIFMNLGGKQFDELSPSAVGRFFESKISGRSLAVLDFNRDGLTDFVISPLDDNFVLLANESTSKQHWIDLALIGTSVSRNAIGANVVIKTELSTHRQQLTAGDGYQVSNERIMHFGLGQDQRINEIHVEWSNGKIQTISNLNVDKRYIIVEGGKVFTHP